VTAQGGLRWYTPGTAERLGLHQRGQRCLGCAEAEKCPFYLNLTADPGLKALYYDQEGWDGYLRDQCVFSAGTDIEDVLHALVRFRGGVEMNYSLHAWMPWEGFTIAVNGSKGRLEHVHRETVYANGERDGRLEPEIRTRIIPHFSNGWEEEIWKGEGLHGGGDERLLADIFATPPPPDPLCLRADERGGAWAALLGAGINLSLAEGGWVNLSDMVQGLDFPAYAPMPRPGESFVLRRGESLREHGLP